MTYTSVMLYAAAVVALLVAVSVSSRRLYRASIGVAVVLLLAASTG